MQQQLGITVRCCGYQHVIHIRSITTAAVQHPHFNYTINSTDFDFGVDVLRSHLWRFKFPWLLSNVMDSRTGNPLGGAQRSTIIIHQGINIGLLGLVEREWLLTIPSIEADRDILFLDFIDEGRKLAKSLRDSGADIVIALTHMRSPNDRLLAAAVPEIQLLLGGHDHETEIVETTPHSTCIS